MMKLMHSTAWFYHLLWMYTTCNLILIQLSATALPDQLSSWWEAGYQVTTDFHWMVKSVILFYLFFNQILNSWSQQTFEIGSAFPKAWSAEPSRFLVCTSASTTVTTVMECPCKPHHSPTRSLQFFTAGDAHAKHQWETQHTVQHIWHCSWIPFCRSYCSQICRISTWSYSAF